MSITKLYIGSTHINDKKIIDRLCTHYQQLLNIFLCHFDALIPSSST